MFIRTVTGSDEPLDNWTSLYTFALGIIGGAFVVVAVGDVDMAQGLRGDLLRVYLTLLTAMFAAALAFGVSRITDRISDRRSIRRKTRAAGLRLGRLAIELEIFRNAFINVSAEGLDGLPSMPQAERIKVFLNRLDTATMDAPDFDDLVETDADQEQADRALRWFRYYSTHTDVIMDATAPLADQRAGLGRFLMPHRLEIASNAKADLEAVKAYFQKRATNQ